MTTPSGKGSSQQQPEAALLAHDHGCPVEQIHRVWTTDQGVDPWVLAEETLRFVQAWENRRCTCKGKPPKRPKGVPLTSVYDPDSGLWRPPADAHAKDQSGACEKRTYQQEKSS